MAPVYNLFKNKDIYPVSIGILLLGYLYLETPLPFNMVLQNSSLAVSILIALLIVYYLYLNVNVYVAIIFIIVAYEIIRKSMKQDPKYLNKDVNFYNKFNSNTNNVISNKLKDSDTLEQEIVNTMVPTINHNTSTPTPKYQSVLTNINGTAPVDYDGML